MNQFRIENFWRHNITTADETWFARFIHHRFQRFPNVLLSSVMGPVESICRRDEEFWIHYSGENTFERYREYSDHRSIGADLILDFWPELRKNAIRFPIWLWYFFEPNWGYSEIQGLISLAEEKKLNIQHRPISLAMVAGHEGFFGCPRRSMVASAAGVDLELKSEGNFAKNSKLLENEYSDDLMAYLADVKLFFCPENSQCLGYTTEKIFSGILNGVVPIYWGSGGVPEFDVLNQQRIIKIEDKGVDGAIAFLDELLQKPSLLKEFSSQRIFKDDAAKVIHRYFTAFEESLHQTGRFER